MKKKRLLYLNNGTSSTSVNKLDDQFKNFGLNVKKYWAFNNEFPKNLLNYDGIFISGSPHGAYEDIPFINREHDLIIEAAQREMPMLGICFGQQILASALCGREQVFRRKSCEVGYKRLKTTQLAKNDNISSHLGENVYMFVWHNDEVYSDHPDLNIISSATRPPIITIICSFISFSVYNFFSISGIDCENPKAPLLLGIIDTLLGEGTLLSK